VNLYRIDFSKIQGCGNSFVICEKQKRLPKNFNWGKLSRRICDMNYGIGADTLLVVSTGFKAPYLMGVYNPDGSKAQVSGNGARCVVRYLYEKGVSSRNLKEIETVKGIISAEILNSKPEDFTVRVNLGRQVKEIKNMSIKVRGKAVEVIYLDIGNPHAVLLRKKLPRDWRSIGSLIEHHPVYPKRVNVEFAGVINRREMEVRIWERGVGEVLSSGTGASAAVLAGIFAGKLDSRVKAKMQGGSLEIAFDSARNNLHITGPAEIISKGIFYHHV
jgi:diaminopimelate epimerase